MYFVTEAFTIGGRQIKLITIRKNNSMEVKLLNYGATIVEILLPDRNGIKENIVLTYENIQDYINNPAYFGTTIGRTSGRIANGIFKLGGKEYPLNKNFDSNHGHGGAKGFSFQVWDYNVIENHSDIIVEFTYTSKDMEEGYPGNLNVKVIYRLTEDNQLFIEYEAISDKKTLCNLTNHTYFNLSGNYKNKVTDQHLFIKANDFLELNDQLIPTGKLLDVKNTPMNFTKEKRIGKDIESSYEQLTIANGYDHTWLLAREENQIEMHDKYSGRKMIITTTYPSVVIYTYNYPNNERLKYNKSGSKYDGICFEVQYEPDGIHHENFNSAILDAGEKYYEKTELKFLVV